MIEGFTSHVYSSYLGKIQLSHDPPQQIPSQFSLLKTCYKVGLVLCPSMGTLRQEDNKLKASLDCMVRPCLKQTKKGWGCGSSGRAPAWQVQGSELYHQKEKEERKDRREGEEREGGREGHKGKGRWGYEKRDCLNPIMIAQSWAHGSQHRALSLAGSKGQIWGSKEPHPTFTPGALHRHSLSAPTSREAKQNWSPGKLGPAGPWEPPWVPRETVLLPSP
jgi:hypothetical protein